MEGDGDEFHFLVGGRVVPRGQDFPGKGKLMEGEIEEKVQVIRSHRWTYLYNPANYSIPLVSPKELAEARLAHLSSKNNFPLPAEALFDRDQDPLELHNLVASSPPELASFRQLATDLRRRAGQGQVSKIGRAHV